MAAEVADVANFDCQVVARLPLDVEGVVEGVGQLVGAVVDAERDGLAVVDDLAVWSCRSYRTHIRNARVALICDAACVGQVLLRSEALGFVGSGVLQASCRRDSQGRPSECRRLCRRRWGCSPDNSTAMATGQLEALTKGSCWLTPKGPPVTVPMA